MNHNQLIEYFAQVIQEIFTRVGNAKNLTDDKNAQKLISAVLKSLDTLGIKVNEVMPQELEKTYLQAISGATQDLVAQKVKVDALKPADVIKKKLHVAALTSLVRDTLQDLRVAIRAAKQSATTTIKKVLSKTKREIAKGLIQGNGRKVVAKRVAQAFREEGLVCFKTADNKRLRLDKYAKVVVSYKMRESAVAGITNRCLESGVGLVKISSQKPTCHVCSRFSGLVVSLTGKHKGFKSVKDKGVKLPNYHPHCHCTVSPYVSEYKSDEELQKEKDKWKTFDPQSDNRSESERRAYNKEQEIRRKAHEELKLYEKYRSLLKGEDLPKTIGAFRRIKRNGGESWQKLQLAYRQANRELKTE
ncbi:phage minor capsid protein [Priestia flexa]|uniref:phage minor capsid protein n=1 Tax=Priestia flexa TaxID=86664 RepID=UPI0004730BCB|nr:phage minor capsid protein [Priestia flexa]